MEVRAGQGRLQVADDGAATLAIDVVVDWMAKDFGLVCVSCIDLDFGIAGARDEPVFGRGVSRLLIEHVILRSNVTGWLGLFQPIDRRHEIIMLPTRREVGVKIGYRWLKKQPGVDSARATDGATHIGVDLITGADQSGRSGKDGTVESRYVDATQVGTR